MSWETKMGNFPCCHIECNKEADFIIGTNSEDYTHMCSEHKNYYACADERVIPIIRTVKGGSTE